MSNMRLGDHATANGGNTGNAKIEVIVPTILRDCTGGHNTVTIEAATLAEALDRLSEAFPLLHVHLYGEGGRLRPHVLIFYNGESTRWLERLDVPIQTGDLLEIVQAVSGG